MPPPSDDEYIIAQIGKYVKDGILNKIQYKTLCKNICIKLLTILTGYAILEKGISERGIFMNENNISDTKVMDLAENVQMLSELGFIGNKEENKQFRTMWNQLDDEQKVYFRGLIHGSLSGIIANI